MVENESIKEKYRLTLVYGELNSLPLYQASNGLTFYKTNIGYALITYNMNKHFKDKSHRNKNFLYIMKQIYGGPKSCKMSSFPSVHVFCCTFKVKETPKLSKLCL